MFHSQPLRPVPGKEGVVKENVLAGSVEGADTGRQIPLSVLHLCPLEAVELIIINPGVIADKPEFGFRGK